MTVSQRLDITVLLMMLQPKNLLDAFNFLILFELFRRGSSHIEQFTSQRKYTVETPFRLSQPSHTSYLHTFIAVKEN
jgi:hypothetical protein